MSYLDILSLEEVKNHLRVDDTSDDNAIKRMISSAFRYIEKETNILVYQRNVTYLMENGQAYVYDYPITAVVSPADYDSDYTVRKQNYTIYNYGSETTDLTLTVGYAQATDVPDELIDVALEIVDLLYYKHETGKTIDKDLSSYSKKVLHDNKRFII